LIIVESSGLWKRRCCESKQLLVNIDCEAAEPQRESLELAEKLGLGQGHCLQTVGDIIGDLVKTDELDELAHANVLKWDCAFKVSTFVSNGGSRLWPGRSLLAPLRRPHNNRTAGRGGADRVLVHAARPRT
jgi:hypothetical protein